MAERFNNAEGVVAVGTSLAAADTGGASGDIFTSRTLAGNGTLQATADALTGTRSYVVQCASTAADGCTVNWNETVPPAVGGIQFQWAYISGSGSVAIGTIRGSAGHMSELIVNLDTGSLSVFDTARTSVITSPASVVPRDGSRVGFALVTDPGTGTTDGKSRIEVWTGTPLTRTYEQEITGQNFYRAGGITSRRWGRLTGTGVTGTMAARYDDLRVFDTYAIPGFAAPAVMTVPTATAAATAYAPGMTGSASAVLAPPTATATALARVPSMSAGIPTANYDIILLVGQSNMRGAASDYDAGGVDKYPASIYQGVWTGNTITGIVPATEPLLSQDAASGMGAGHTFATSWAANRLTAGRSVLVINAGRGGTGFSTPSSGDDTAATWQVDAPDDGHNLAWNTVRATQAALALAGSGSRVVAVLANHGSTDGINNQPKATFKARLQAWIDFLRSQLSLPTVPYLMMQMRPSLFGENRHLIIDQAQQETAAEKPWTQFVASPNGSEYNKADAVHFNALGVRTIGNNLYGLLSNADMGAPTALAVAQAYAPAFSAMANATFSWPMAASTAQAMAPIMAGARNAALVAPHATASARAWAPVMAGTSSAVLAAPLATASARAWAPAMVGARNGGLLVPLALATALANVPTFSASVPPVVDDIDVYYEGPYASKFRIDGPFGSPLVN